MTIEQSAKPEVYAAVGGGRTAKRLSFFDLHQTPVVPVVDAEQYCEYPEAITNGDVDLHTFHEEHVRHAGPLLRPRR